MQYYVRITAEVSLIAVSCGTPIYQEQSCLVYVRNTCSIWYFIQFVRIAIFMSLHVPAGACIPVASASPIQMYWARATLMLHGVRSEMKSTVQPISSHMDQFFRSVTTPPI